ncbi:hypothetical protein [Agrobacterium sp. LMR679]|uniref:hypothetical protein n=1 Tax=Agrobacterium sp. LMR679 TaxID=3014335 RepID=UPI0022AEB534|nr:hypothetical protein [Agrobacterium sp. LMR679]MCZ4073573.1 hypothetical protein [Agrobacterium sp. LMR679]MCZ4076285.1 hypothetical protein [Agrobacterium sp. LMR679]
MSGAHKQEMKPATSTEPLGIRLAARICGLDRPPPRASVMSFAISVGVDPNNLRVTQTDDGFGIFPDKAAAAKRLLAMVDDRMEELRKSAAHARRILRAEKKKGGNA